MGTRSTHTGALCVSVLCVVTVGTLGGHTGYSEWSHGVLPLDGLLHVHTRRTLSTHSRYSEYSQGTLSAHTGCSHWVACFMCTHDVL